MVGSTQFPQFAQLPAELRLSIWEAAVSPPSMHLFDVCLPSGTSDDDNSEDTEQESLDRAQIAFGQQYTTLTRYHKFKDTVFFDAHHAANNDVDHATPRTQPPLDPSMYRWKMSLSSACVDAYAATSLSSSPIQTRDKTPISSPAAVFDDAINTVYLPGPDRRIQYNNKNDVLHLCLSSSNKRRFAQELSVPVAASLPPSSPANQTCASKDVVEIEVAEVGLTADETLDEDELTPGLLDVQWSDEMGETLRNARRIAIDAAHTTRFVDLSSPLGLEELVMLACTLQQGLEVLYLIDYCPGRCLDCDRPGSRAADLTKKGGLYKSLNHDEDDEEEEKEDDGRAPDIIWGVGRVYREVFDLEGLGWTDKHPAFDFGRALGAIIRAQQRDTTMTCQFQGVRVLMVEDE
ncbi:hypothetical protein SEUCBS139899_006496 [Sporothrix eucalyptigena]|uniref:2EXR domain-containing protein n=1 Tax=Sporothrix eucalyptigena TaxID=1812306 RepID=A0ABP0CMF3_9PEZI